MAATPARTDRDVRAEGGDGDGEPAAEPAQAGVPETTDQPSGGLDGSSAPATRWWRDHAWRAVAGVVVLVLLAGLIIVGVQWLDRRAAEADREAAAAAARQTAASLTTLNVGTVDADVKQVIDLTTGDFREQFTQNAEPFTNIVRTARVETTSEVVGSGVQSFGDGRARVLVAVRSVVKNLQSPQPQPRNYRMALDLQQEGDRWLTNNVEFVP